MTTYNQRCQIFRGDHGLRRILQQERPESGEQAQRRNYTWETCPKNLQPLIFVRHFTERDACMIGQKQKPSWFRLKWSKSVWIKVSDTCRHPVNLPLLVLAGSVRSLRSEGALLEGVWVQAQLQWPRRHQMGAVHRPLRHLRNSLLKVHLLRAANWPLFLPSILLRFFSSAPSYFVSLLPSVLIASLIQPLPSPPSTATLHPFLTRCWRLNLHH